MTLLYDPFGQVLPPSSRLRSPDDDVIIGLRRKRFHPVIASGLTPERLQGIFSDVERGKTDEFLTLAREIEKHDAHYRSALGQRKLALLKRKPIVTPASDDSRDQFIAEEFDALVSSAGWFWMSLWLSDGIAKGYSCVEIVWDFADGRAVPTFRQRDPRDFTLDRETLTRVVRKKPGTALLEELPWGKYLVHTPGLIHGSPMDSALAWTASILYLYGALALHDWADFIERFGTPALLGHYLAESQRQELLDGLAALSRAGYGALPQGVTVDKLDGARLGGGEKAHELFFRLLDEQKSKLVVGQTMTSDSGSSRSQAEVHDQVKDDITDFDALCLSMTQQGFAEVWVRLNYGEGVEPPTISRPGDEEEDVAQIAEVMFRAADRGAKVPVRHLLQLLGVEEPTEDEDMLEPLSTGLGDIPGTPGRMDPPEPAPEPEPSPPTDAEVEADQAAAQ